MVPDNTKDAVRRPCRYEPDLNASYADWATHYGVAVIPARVRHPRDKAKAESGVLVVERWILAALRHRTFFSLGELNEAIAELLERLTTRTFRKLPGNRRRPPTKCRTRSSCGTSRRLAAALGSGMESRSRLGSPGGGGAAGLRGLAPGAAAPPGRRHGNP